MVRSRFEFAGQNSVDYCLTIEKLPAISAPAKKYKTISVPGRNGDLHIEENAFQNYTQPYECWFKRPNTPPSEVAHAIKEWLLGSNGYQVLKDTYDPNHFRKATFLGPMDIEQLLNGFGRCTILFDCAPQSFLESGKFPVNFENPGTLYNPTAFTALPIIYVYGTGAGTVTVGSTVVTVHEIEGQLILDCEMQNAYEDGGEGAAENKNSCIYAPEFPSLVPGSNAVSWTGDIERVEIIPRWWEL